MRRRVEPSATRQAVCRVGKSHCTRVLQAGRQFRCNNCRFITRPRLQPTGGVGTVVGSDMCGSVSLWVHDSVYPPKSFFGNSSAENSSVDFTKRTKCSLSAPPIAPLIFAARCVAGMRVLDHQAPCAITHSARPTKRAVALYTITVDRESCVWQHGSTLRRRQPNTIEWYALINPKPKELIIKNCSRGIL